ncbi:MAG: adenosylcobalamin-dependent ribonucleoside-diphosphate reductase [Cyanobacteria bacterium SZAS LIN-2]|nr:adenosylcobalamin-dependent ribonucleoside-diphosphate reductase [Cyanobacteria bacterium SZAS LIN-2]
MFSENAYKVLNKRYFLRDDEGLVNEDIDGLFSRVAGCVAAVETRWGLSSEAVSKLADTYKQFMISQQFMPNSPTLMNAGKEQGQLSACFVLPVPDNLEGIFETCKNAALIHKTGGGTGFSFSRIRPRNDRVAHSVGVASGPVSFMMVYDAATEAIRQGGTRRGANMGMLRIDHPDIEHFISAKRDTSKLNNFNISVAVTDKFMQAVKDDADFDLVHPSRLVDGQPEVLNTVRARELFDTIVQNAHATGEPGMVFIDRINQADPLVLTRDASGQVIYGTEDIEATNPCGEQPLGPGDACNLGSINLVKFLTGVATDGCGFADFDWPRLGEAIELAVRFLDDVIDANHYPFEFIRQATLNNRRIGLGLMGWAEALILMGIAYDSEAAIAKADELGVFFQETAHRASRALAAERGNFPNWQYSTWGSNGVPMRNATVTTIAPTGTISIIAGTSSGIEPLFAISYLRRVLGGMELLEVNPLFEQVAKERGFYSEELMRAIASQGTLKHVPGVPEDIRGLWTCAHDIDYIWHVRMQAAFQKHIDNAVSKTINFPYEATTGQVRDAYMAAWDQGLKGITVYRDRSRSGQVLNIQKADDLPKKHRSAGRAGTVTSPQTRGALALALLPEAIAEDLSMRRICDELCPQCGAKAERFLKFEACRRCPSCGYTKC